VTRINIGTFTPDYFERSLVVSPVARINRGVNPHAYSTNPNGRPTAKRKHRYPVEAKVIYWHLIMTAIYNLFQGSFFINFACADGRSGGRQVDSAGPGGAIPKRRLFRESCARNGGRIPQGLRHRHLLPPSSPSPSPSSSPSLGILPRILLPPF